MAFPDFNAGDLLSAAGINARFWHEVTQGSDQNSTTTTLANTNIVIPRVNGETYIVRVWVRWSVSDSSLTDIKFDWTGDGTITRNYIALGDDATGSTTSQTTLQMGRAIPTSAIVLNAPTSGAYTYLEELRTTGTDNLVLRFARTGGSGTATLAGTSYCHYLRIG
jgi:hypothetical protein